MLYSIVIVSKVAMQVSADELTYILTSGRDKNRSLGITGALLHRNGEFLQVLEGVRRRVEDQRQRIALDHRICRIETLLSTRIDERRFPGSALAFHDLDDIQTAGRAGYAPYRETGFSDPRFKAEPARALDLLLSFRDLGTKA